LKKKILLSSNSYWNFFNFRRELIKKLIELKFEVHLAAPFDKNLFFFKKKGCFCHTLNFSREKKGVIDSIKLIINYYSLIKSINPFFYLPFTIKPNIFGSLVCSFFKVITINNITGLGSGFLNSFFLKYLIIFFYKIALKKSKVIFFQNNNDKFIFEKKKIINNKKHLSFVLPGSGIDMNYFKLNIKKRRQKINFLYAGRLIKDKGIYELFEAIKAIKIKYKNLNFIIVGDIDNNNLFPLNKKLLKYMKVNKLINHYKFTDKILRFYKQADCFILPSYREGLSRSLLEAASCSLPLISTNVPGCKELVKSSYNGFLCPPKNYKGIVKCIEKFINLSHHEVKKFGLNSRKLVRSKYSINKVINIYVQQINRLSQKN